MNILKILLSWCYSVLLIFLYQQAGIYILLWTLVFTLAGIFLTTSPVRQKSCNFCLCIVWVSFYVLPRHLRFLESYSYYTSWICEMAVRRRVLWDTIFPSTTGLFFRFAFCSNCFKVFLNLKEANHWLRKVTYTCKHFFCQNDHLLNCPRNWC